MTPEQRKHHEEYDRAKSRYERAYSEKRHAENEISNILNRRQQIISKINELTSEKKLNISSLEELQRSHAKNSDFESSVKDTELKLEAASNGFSAIGECSLATPKKLTDVFDEKNRKSKSSIVSAFEQIKKVSNSIEGKIAELERQIANLQRELEEGKNKERHLNNVIAEQNRIMNNASIDMAYHKRHMND